MTGNYYAGNDFSVMEMDILDATDELVQVIGKAVYDKAEQAYLENNNDRLVQLVQRPVALLATLHFFQRNDVSHEDSGPQTVPIKYPGSGSWIAMTIYTFRHITLQ